ncbi:MAG: DNA-directed RNA polymerase subunit omega [Saprospiraceae bacterium]
MSDIKSKVQGLESNIQARNIHELVKDTDNIYESLTIISKRAKQVAVDLKQELHSKLEEFAVTSDTIEEIHENKEQIEISKFYERLPNPVLIAMDEFLNDDIHARYQDKSAENDI